MMMPGVGIEPTCPCGQGILSPPRLPLRHPGPNARTGAAAPAAPVRRFRRAGNGTRTRDPNLGKVVLYQLSYSRGVSDRGRRDGGEGNRTPDLLNAIQALSQLSYAPVIFGRPQAPPRREDRKSVV